MRKPRNRVCALRPVGYNAPTMKPSSSWKTISVLVLLLVALSVSGAPQSVEATARSAAFCDSVSQIPTVECQALVDLYNSTGGASWTNRSDWLATSTPCSWYGVNCYGGHVYRIILNYNGLSGTLPASLGSLAGLRNLVLQSNQLSGGIPDSVGNLASLEELSLAHNQLSGDIPASLGNLRILRQVHLYNNNLSGGIPASLGNLPSLRGLYLHSNALSGNIPGSLGNIASLEELDLADNQLSGGIPDSLGNLAHLQTLLVDNNGLTGAVPDSLTGLANLMALTVDHNLLSGALPTGLKNLPLTYFYFDATNLCEPLEAGFQEWLAGIPYLRRTGVFCGNPTFKHRVRIPIAMRIRTAQ